jgi:predicted phage tail protein
MAVETVRQERSLSQLLVDLTNQTRQLFEQEVALAKAEVNETISNYVRHAIHLVVAGAIAYAALLVLIAAAVLGAATWLGMPLWGAAAMVGGLLLIVAAVLYTIGRSGMRRETPVPTQTIESVKENVEWAKRHAQ